MILAKPHQSRVLIQQPDLGHDPHRHPGIHRTLELNQDIQVHPLSIHLDPPYDVVRPVAQIVGDVAARHPLQRGVVQAVMFRTS